MQMSAPKTSNILSNHYAFSTTCSKRCRTIFQEYYLNPDSLRLFLYLSDIAWALHAQAPPALNVILPNRRSARSMLATAATAVSLDQVQHDLFESLGVPFQGGGGGGGGGTGLSTGGANGGAPAAASAAAASAQRPASMMYQQHRIGSVSGVGAGVGGGAAAAAGALAAATGVRHGHSHSGTEQ